MLTAFSTALSALNADSTAISVVGNNIANLNTTGYKASSVSFQDLLYQNLSDGSSQVGTGVRTPIATKVFAQGATPSTASTLDAAITGSGFFSVRTASGAVEYTRDGSFKADSKGNLVTATGEFVQGWTAVNGAVNTNSVLGNIVLPTGKINAGATTANLSMTMNLDSNAPNTSQYVSGSSGPQNPPTYTAPSIQVYDSLGQPHTLTLNFWKTATAASASAPSSWTWQASVPSGDGTTSSTGTLHFSQAGNLVDNTGNPVAPGSGWAVQPISITGLTDGASNLSFNWNLLSGPTPTVTQYSQASAVSTNFQDGSAPGNISNVSIETGGIIRGSLSSGGQLTLGQLAVANFVNPESLTGVGNNKYQVTSGSSNPSVGTAGLGGRGDVQGSSLESSTVDIATEFTKLMTYQNSYEAASRIITTADTIIQQTVNLISGSS